MLAAEIKDKRLKAAALAEVAARHWRFTATPFGKPDPAVQAAAKKRYDESIASAKDAAAEAEGTPPSTTRRAAAWALLQWPLVLSFVGFVLAGAAAPLITAAGKLLGAGIAERLGYTMLANTIAEKKADPATSVPPGESLPLSTPVLPSGGKQAEPSAAADGGGM